MKQIWLTIFASFGSKIYIGILQFLTLVITARVLGPEGRGQIATIIAWSTLLAAVFGLSLHQVSIYKVTSIKDEGIVKDLFSSLFFLSFIFSTVAIIVYLYIYLFTGNKAFIAIPDNLFILGLMLVPLMIWHSYSSHLLIATDKLVYQIKSDVIGRTAGFIIMLVTLYWLNFGIYSPVIGILIWFAISISIALFILRPYVNFKLGSSLNNVKDLIYSGVKLHINTIGSLVLMSLDTIVIGHYMDTTDVGIYQAASQMIFSLLILPAAVTSVLFSRISQDGVVTTWSQQRKIIPYIMLFILTIAIFLYLLSDTLFIFLFGSEFLESIEVFNILLLAMVGMSFSQLMVSQWIGRGLFIQAGIITVSIAACNLSLNIIYIPVYGITAAAWTTVASFTISIITNFIFLYYIEKQWHRRSAHE